MARYSRKDYQMIADHIQEQYVEAYQEHGSTSWPKLDVLVLLAKSFSKTFREDNPNFREDQFLTACGVQK